MHRLPVWMLASAAALAVVGSSADARAQYVTYYRPAAPVVAYYAPAPAVYSPAPVAYSVASPVVVEPAYLAAPAVPVLTYYRAPTVAYQPVARVHTRYRPFLGGTVSRVRYSYMPVVIP